VYGRDHGVPHFHIEGREFRCSVAIDKLELIIGAAPPGVLRMAIAWARANQAELTAKWQELNQ
jgi:hypothetical protein